MWPLSRVTVRCCLVKQLALVMNSVILRIWLVFPGGLLSSVTVGLGCDPGYNWSGDQVLQILCGFPTSESFLAHL